MNFTMSRRNFIRRFAVGAGVGLLAPSIMMVQRAAGQAGDTQLVCQANAVNVRSEPSLSGRVLDQVYGGEIVNKIGGPVAADGYTWIEVAGYGRQMAPGWVAAEFFSSSGLGDWQIGTHVYVSTDVLNVRAEPGLGGAVVTTITRNTHAIIGQAGIQRDGYLWYGITLDDGTSGWAASDFLSTTPPNDEPDGWPAGTSVRVASNGLRMRSGPGVGHEVLNVYQRGADGVVIEGPLSGDGYLWYRVEMYGDGMVGWFAADFLEQAKYEPTGDRWRVNNGPLNVRSGPGLDNAVVTTVPVGDVIVIADASAVYADNYEWWLVSIEDQPGTEGWIAAGFAEAI